MAIKLPSLVTRGGRSAGQADGSTLDRLPEGIGRPVIGVRSSHSTTRLTTLISVVAEATFLLFATCILVVTVRGIPGNPTPDDLQQPSWQLNGPLELSPERGHFALTLALAENRTTQFSIPLARFATPDVGYIRGHYVSLFQPGLSVVLLPGYLIGRAHGLAQVGSYLAIAVFALANAWLIRLIAVHLGASRLAGWIGGLTFLFASPAFTYAVSLFQHHVTLFLLLCPMYLLLKWRGPFVVALTWTMYGLAIFVDYPSAVLLAPLAVLAAIRVLGVSELGPSARRYLAQWSARANDVASWFTVSLRFKPAVTVLGFLLPMGMILWFNYQSYGNPLQLSGTVPQVAAIDSEGRPAAPTNADPTRALAFLRPEEQAQSKSVSSFFDTRLLLQGLYLHILSPDRGMLYFTPVMFFGILGGWLLARKKRRELSLVLAVIGLDLTLYSMWGDPWGGWAFGSRYLVPTYAMLAILIAVALSQIRNKVVLGLFSLALVYSLAVNALGALTSSLNPPQVEAGPLEQQSHQVELYTWQRNWSFLQTHGSKSALYQTVAVGHLTATQYYWLIAASLVLCALALLVWMYLRDMSRTESA